jgi:hypothetical protein
MPRVGFESTIAKLKRAKKVHALDSSANVIGLLLSTSYRQRNQINEADMSSIYGKHWYK